ncbi:MAG: hypothetical protein Q9221_004059 [Calogaya cf. arnoldii]
MAPKKDNAQKKTRKKGTPKQTPVKATPQIETPGKDTPKVSTPRAESPVPKGLAKVGLDILCRIESDGKNPLDDLPPGLFQKDTPKTTLKEVTLKQTPVKATREPIKSVSTSMLNGRPFNESMLLDKNGIPKSKCHSPATGETIKALINVPSKDVAPSKEFPALGYFKTPSTTIKHGVDFFDTTVRKKDTPRGEPLEDETPEDEPPEDEIETLRKHCASLEEWLISQKLEISNLRASLDSIMDLTQFGPLKRTMMRVFFEALCIRLGKVEELVGRISYYISYDTHGTEYDGFFDLFYDITAQKNSWVSRTRLPLKYADFLADNVFLLHSCQDLIRNVRSADENTNPPRRVEYANRAKEKDVVQKDNAEKENVKGKQDASTNKNATQCTSQKDPLNDKTNKDISRRQDGGKDTPGGKQQVSKNQQTKDDTRQKALLDQTTMDDTYGKTKINRGTLKGQQEMSAIANAYDIDQREALIDKAIDSDAKAKNETQKGERKMSKHKTANDHDKKNTTVNDNVDKGTSKGKLKAPNDECTYEDLIAKKLSKPQAHTRDILNTTLEQKGASELIPKENHLPDKTPTPEEYQQLGLERLPKLTPKTRPKEITPENPNGAKLTKILDDFDNLKPHTAFQVIDGDPTALHTETIAFANLLLRHKNEEGFWAEKYNYFAPIFLYVYGGTIDQLSRMGAVNLGRCFPKGKDPGMLSKEEAAEQERENEREIVEMAKRLEGEGLIIKGAEEHCREVLRNTRERTKKNGEGLSKRQAEEQQEREMARSVFKKAKEVERVVEVDAAVDFEEGSLVTALVAVEVKVEGQKFRLIVRREKEKDREWLLSHEVWKEKAREILRKILEEIVERTTKEGLVAVSKEGTKERTEMLAELDKRLEDMERVAEVKVEVEGLTEKKVKVEGQERTLVIEKVALELGEVRVYVERAKAKDKKLQKLTDGLWKDKAREILSEIVGRTMKKEDLVGLSKEEKIVRKRKVTMEFYERLREWDRVAAMEVEVESDVKGVLYLDDVD